MNKQPQKKKPLREDYRHRNGSNDDRVRAEVGIGIMRHKDGTIEKRKF